MDFVRYLRLVAIFGLCLFTSVEARADLIIATPSGMSLGDQFRIVFLTNGVTQATSSDIGYYNTFVNDDAISQAGGVGNNVVYGGTTLTWTAIASTNSVSAITNIGSFGVPVYTASGTLITPSDTAAGLWSGLLVAPINQFLTSPFFFDTGVWTGTLQSGTAAGSFTLGSGSGFGSIPGLSNKTNAEWVETGATPSSFTNNMYGISQVLTAVPEPSTSIMAFAGLACGGFSMWRRRKRARQSDDVVVFSALFRKGSVTKLLLVALCSVLMAGAVQAAPFTELISFGDSLSDVGNAAGITKPGVAPLINGYYQQTHFSDNVIWNETLAAYWGLPDDLLRSELLSSWHLLPSLGYRHQRFSL